MFVRVLLLASLICGASLTPTKSYTHGRIVGGRDASILDFPYQISLQYYNSHMCGGSIISTKYVVTAGHCTYGVEAKQLSVRVNTSIVESGGTVINVKTINRDYKYNPSTVDYDISILELETPLLFGQGIQPILLPQPGQTLWDGTSVYVSGWGTIKEYVQELSPQLQVVEVSVINREVCQKAYSWENSITDRMICAGTSKGGKDSCQGDSGGPLIANGTLFGIVSWGYGCAKQGYPGVYGNVAALRDYITEITNL